MKRQPINMFAATNEDLPLFSGACVDVEVAEFQPVEVQEEVKPLPMFTAIEDRIIEYMKHMTTEQLLNIAYQHPVYGNWFKEESHHMTHRDIVTCLLDAEYGREQTDAAFSDYWQG